MAPNTKLAEACKAMKNLGYSEKIVKPVVQELLELYENNWMLIEEDSYQVLVDAVLDSEEQKARSNELENLNAWSKDEAEETEPLLKRSKLSSQKNPPSTSFHVSILKCSNEVVENQPHGKQKMGESTNERHQDMDIELMAPRVSKYCHDKGKTSSFPLSLTVVEQTKKPKLISDDGSDESKFLVPLVHLESSGDESDSCHDFSKKRMKTYERGNCILFCKETCNLHDDDLALVEKVFDKHLCEAALENPHRILLQGSSYENCSNAKGNCSIFPEVIDLDAEDICTAPCLLPKDAYSVGKSSDLERNQKESMNLKQSEAEKNENDARDSLELEMERNIMELNSRVPSSSRMMIVQKQRCYHYIKDISSGQEACEISLINEINEDQCPTFNYITKNVTYQNAYVRFLLAHISEENCCTNCSGDCLSVEIPCTCAGETGCEFAYSLGGLVKEKFLNNFISMDQCLQQRNLFYCQECPLERFNRKNLSAKCKGHVVRKFIKECWDKCGCSMKCGNRVVQQGITAKLQVFMTPEKGWGLRTLEDIPKGAFICEYVGEVVTNKELFKRNMRNTGDKHTYTVLLDADWSSEGVLKDEQALCLDATVYGNVARFINHRCFDANLVEILLKWRLQIIIITMYLAFFTTRKVNALEELTWDYGIDFNDDHPVKAFQCRCGNKFCRDRKSIKVNMFHYTVNINCIYKIYLIFYYG
ncbi:hypothetical protein Pfo_031158 [Paulownia fortunei]|nr:hypothetical protein Pfo_031158 [Paulownia fortunei]